MKTPSEVLKKHWTVELHAVYAHVLFSAPWTETGLLRLYFPGTKVKFACEKPSVKMTDKKG